MATFLALSILLVASIVLSRSAGLVVKAVVILSRRLHISEFNMGFFILGLATSTPEFFVGINSALEGHPELSMGNLIGASIVLLSLIIGLTAILNKEILFSETLSPRTMLLTGFVIFIPAILSLDGSVSRFDGLALISFYTIFYVYLNEQQTFAQRIEENMTNHTHIFKILIGFCIGLAGLFIASKFMVDAAHFLATDWQIPLTIIGLLILSIGTNLPEITMMLTTTSLHHKNVAVGDFLGSAAANTPILGMVALLHPITLEAPINIYFSFGILLLVLITCAVFFNSQRKLTRLEGTFLVGLYGIFLLTELFLKGVM